MCTCLWLPLLGKALLQCCGFGGNGGVLPGNRGGGVGAEAVKLRGQLVVGHGQNRHSQIRGVLRAVQRYGCLLYTSSGAARHLPRRGRQGGLAPSARGLRPQAVGGEKFALLLRFRRYDYSFLFVLDWLSGLS